MISTMIMGWGTLIGKSFIYSRGLTIIRSKGSGGNEDKEVDRDQIRKTSYHMIISEHYPMGSEEVMKN